MQSYEHDALPATSARVQLLGEVFEGRQAKARVLSLEHEGTVGQSETPGALMIDEVEIVIPPSATIRVGVRAGSAGIETNSDLDPEPNGMWLWLPCDAVAEAHHIFEQLRDL